MRAVCIIASDNVVIDGDVVFTNKSKSSMDCAIFCDSTYNSVRFTENATICASAFSLSLPPKLMLLWLWHMVVLRKSHVYLTGANR